MTTQFWMISMSLLSLGLLSAPAEARHAGPPLVKLKDCQPYYGAKSIMECDAKGAKVEGELNQALDAVYKYNNSCKAYKEAPTQSSEELQRLTAEAGNALKQSEEARRAFDELDPILQKTIFAFQNLGERGNCLRSLQGLKVKLNNKVQGLQEESNRLAGCLGMKRECSKPDPGAAQAQCGPGEAPFWNTQKCWWNCAPLAQPW